MEFRNDIARSSKGFTIIEMLVTLVIAGAVTASVMSQFSITVRQSRDHSLRVAAQVQAQALVQTITAELRVLGNGVPFDQPEFEIGEIDLIDPGVTEPIKVADCTATKVAFRLNETGAVALLTATYDSAASFNVGLTSVEGINVNDPIYITNAVMSGDEGLYATVAAVDTATNVITLNNDIVTDAGATFEAGSVLEVVPIVTYESDADTTSVTRDSGFGPVVMSSNATLSLEYLDWNGNVLPLPLTNDDVVNLLRAIRVTVTQNSDSPLSSGTVHTATVTQTVGLRNLNFLY